MWNGNYVCEYEMCVSVWLLNYLVLFLKDPQKRNSQEISKPYLIQDVFIEIESGYLFDAITTYPVCTIHFFDL